MTALYHDSVWAGAHQGVEKTLDKITQRFYHPSIRAYVKTWCKTCDICNRNKRAHPIGSANKHEMGQIQVTRPWELVCIDIWEPGVVSNIGNKAVLTVIDVFSRFAWAIPLPDTSADTIAFALYTHVFSHFPIPTRLHSDMGKNLIGKVMTQMENLFHIKQSHTSAYHPEGNAVAERIHQFFRNALTAYISDDQADWDMFIPAIMRIYLDATHNGLGNLYSPSEIIFGRKLGSVDSDNLLRGCDGEKAFVERLRLALSRAASLVLRECETRRRKKIELKEHRDKILLDNKLYRWVSKTRKNPFKPGDRVGLRVEQVGEEFESKKLFPRFQGPFIITSVSKDNKAVYLRNPYSTLEEVSPVPVSRLIDFPLRPMNMLPNEVIEIDNSDEEVDQEKLFQRVDELDNYSYEENIHSNDHSIEDNIDMDVEFIANPIDPLSSKINFDLPRGSMHTEMSDDKPIEKKSSSGRVIKTPERYGNS
jgi:hypothetical protein